MSIDWAYCQTHSDRILREGLSLLEAGPPCVGGFPQAPGNYLISAGTDFVYVGEGKDIRKRLKQQLRGASSTFYRNYLGACERLAVSAVFAVEDFEVRVIETAVGRKEIEDFGIVNLPANLNRFQLGKRRVFSEPADGLWAMAQTARDELLAQGERAIFGSPTSPWFDLIAPKGAGLYVVEHPEMGLLYIGESSSVAERYGTHSTTTRMSALRRHIAEDLLDFELIAGNDGKKMRLPVQQDLAVTEFLRGCKIRAMSLGFGRYELEEHLIRKHRPLLNRKDNYN